MRNAWHCGVIIAAAWSRVIRVPQRPRVLRRSAPATTIKKGLHYKRSIESKLPIFFFFFFFFLEEIWLNQVIEP